FVSPFQQLIVSRVVCHHRGRVCERRDSLRACWFLYVIRWCGPDAAAGSGFLERWSDPNLSPLLLNGLLRDLAADPLNRRAIVQDQGCLPGLILFMDHPNPPVIHSALLALRYLAECRANREKMKGELGMMLSLQSVIQKTTTPGETKLLASEIYEILQSSNMADGDSFNEMNSRRRKAQFFLGTTNKRAKTVVLHIDGLDDTVRLL
ncbi:hypothetical protein E2I00_013211, partial [Balaenoptera physalus]